MGKNINPFLLKVGVGFLAVATDQFPEMQGPARNVKILTEAIPIEQGPDTGYPPRSAMNVL